MDEEKKIEVGVFLDSLFSVSLDGKTHKLDEQIELPEIALTRRVLFEKVNHHSFEWLISDMQESLLKTMNATLNMMTMLELYERTSKEIGDEEMDSLINSFIDSTNPASPDVS